MPDQFTIGIFWCTKFRGRFWSSSLRSAYRPPGLFASTMAAEGYSVRSVCCDELLDGAKLSGASLFDDIDLAYFMTHGIFDDSGYGIMLNSSLWRPPMGALRSDRLRIVVFDTCNLVDTQSYAAWQPIWRGNAPASNVRLLLGFDGLAAIDHGSAMRGQAFAEDLLQGRSFADSWRAAVRGTTASQYSRAITIGLGDTAADAAHVLATSRLGHLPGARGTGAPFLELRR